MNVFEKILERLDKEEKLAYKDMMIAKRVNVANYHSGEKDAYRISRKIVQEVEEEYNGGWIACSDRLPEERDWYLAVFEEVDTGFIGLPCIAEYLMGKHTISTTEDGWIIHNCTDREDGPSEYYIKLRCVAWQPLPEQHQECD